MINSDHKRMDIIFGAAEDGGHLAKLEPLLFCGNYVENRRRDRGKRFPGGDSQQKVKIQAIPLAELKSGKVKIQKSESENTNYPHLRKLCRKSAARLWTAISKWRFSTEEEGRWEGGETHFPSTGSGFHE